MSSNLVKVIFKGQVVYHRSEEVDKQKKDDIATRIIRSNKEIVKTQK